MEGKNKREMWKALWKKYGAVIPVLAAGVLLLIWPSGETEREEAAAADTDSTAFESLLQTEERMERLLARVEGIGSVRLMLTLETSARQELAADTELSYKGTAAAPEDYSRQTETVIVSNGNNDIPVVTYSVSPAYRGAVVVCQGADRAEVRLAVTQAVSALTGLGSDRIVVIKCQS